MVCVHFFVQFFKAFLFCKKYFLFFYNSIQKICCLGEIKHKIQNTRRIITFSISIFLKVMGCVNESLAKHTRVKKKKGASGGVMVSKLDKQTFTSEFESHWVPLSYGLVPHLSKSLVNFH